MAKLKKPRRVLEAIRTIIVAELQLKVTAMLVARVWVKGQ